MKKITFLIAFLCLAQLTKAQTNLGFRIGADAGLFSVETENRGSADVSPRFNVIFGMDIDVPFTRVLSFRTGLNLVQKSAEVNRTLDMNTPDSNWFTLYRMTCLEFPFLLVARWESDFGTFSIGAGPTFAFGMGGQVNVVAQNKNDNKQREYDQKLEWKGKTGNTTEENFYRFKRLDMGLGAMFSYQPPRSGLTFTVTANKGYRDITPSDETKFSTAYIGLSIGFMMQN